MGKGRPTVVRQSAVQDVAQQGWQRAITGGGEVRAAGREAAERLGRRLPAVAKQVVIVASHRATIVGHFCAAAGGRVARKQAAHQGEAAAGAIDADAAAVVDGAVAGDGAVIHCERARAIDSDAARFVGGVARPADIAADRAIVDGHQGALDEDAAAGAFAGVDAAVDRAAIHREVAARNVDVATKAAVDVTVLQSDRAAAAVETPTAAAAGRQFRRIADQRHVIERHIATQIRNATALALDRTTLHCQVVQGEHAGAGHIKNAKAGGRVRGANDGGIVAVNGNGTGDLGQTVGNRVWAGIVAGGQHMG